MNESKVLTAMVLVGLLFVLAPSANAELIAHYEFDSNFDYTVGVANGTGVGDAAVSTTTAKVGAGSLELDGSGDYVHFGDNYDFGTGNFSVAMWVNLDEKRGGTSAYRHTLFYKCTDASTNDYNPQVCLYVNNDGKLRGYMNEEHYNNNGDSIETPPHPSDAVDDGNWHHVAMTVDRAGDMFLYVNGTADTGTSTSIVNGSLDNNGLANIGESLVGTNPRYVDGFVDDFRIYNHVLTQSEINALVPEPSTLALLVTGLIGLLCYAWRKRK